MVVLATLVSAGAVLLVVVLLVVAVTISLVVKCAHKPTNKKEGTYVLLHRYAGIIVQMYVRTYNVFNKIHLYTNI